MPRVCGLAGDRCEQDRRPPIARSKAEPQAALTAPPPPPKRGWTLFGYCRQCRALILFDEDHQIVSPCFGLAHICTNSSDDAAHC
jgi:hypothetical protein